MNVQNTLPGWLHRCGCPGFLVKDHRITHCNQAAEALLLTPGTEIRPLLLTGSAEYAAFQGGCLSVQLALSSRGRAASITREDGYDLFLLEQEPEDDGLCALALAARELRNPLSNLMIAADSLARCTDSTPGIQEQLARLNRSLHQLHRLVNNMSDAAQSDLLSSPGLHDWNRLLHDIFEKLQCQLEDSHIRLTYEGLPESVWGLANEGQIQRAICNIVSNAMKFMSKGGTITAKLTRQKNMLHLSIQDSGSGIAETVLGTVFSRYQRQPGIEDSRYGIGLGMVLVRTAAADHGGTVLIDCPQGGGTRVTMTLAIRQDSTQLKSPVLPLLADDSQQILTELSDCLSWEAYKK